MTYEKVHDQPYEIRGWDSSDEDFEISIRVNGYRFAVFISQDNFRNSPVALARFHSVLNKLIAGEDDDPDVWDYGEEVANLFLPDFRRLAPPVMHKGKLTLADLSARGAFECEFRVENEKSGVIAVRERVPEVEACDEWNVHKIQAAFPVLDPKEVEVPYSDGSRIYDIIPQKVIVNGQSLYYKTSWSPYDPIDEIGKYAKIKSSNLSPLHLHTSRLFGIVANLDGQTRGLLYDWIDTDGHGTLRSMISPETPMELREKWADQIKSTLTQLHEIGVLWGDVKADNVLIDKNGNAVVIDLEGGRTSGWVDHDVAGTIQGDEQGLERMMDFIFNDNSPLRQEECSDDDDDYSMDED